MNWQLIFVVLLFAASLAFLGRRMVRRFAAKKKPGCEKCGAG